MRPVLLALVAFVAFSLAVWALAAAASWALSRYARPCKGCVICRGPRR